MIIEGIKVFKDYIKYKDETPKQREKRFKIEKMIKNWRGERKFIKFSPEFIYINLFIILTFAILVASLLINIFS